MDFQTFKASLGEDTPPRGLRKSLQALWQEANGEWDEAHRLAQMDDGPAGAWVHAYLHRKEGDAANVAYWYRVADRPVARGTFDDEWRAITEALLSETS